MHLDVLFLTHSMMLSVFSNLTWGQRSMAVFVHWSMCHFNPSQGSIITKQPYLPVLYHWWTAKGKDNRKANDRVKWGVIALKSLQVASQSFSLFAAFCHLISVSTSQLKCVSNHAQHVFFKGHMQWFTSGPLAPKSGKRSKCTTCAHEDAQPYSWGREGE